MYKKILVFQNTSLWSLWCKLLNFQTAGKSDLLHKSDLWDWMSTLIVISSDLALFRLADQICHVVHLSALAAILTKPEACTGIIFPHTVYLPVSLHSFQLCSKALPPHLKNLDPSFHLVPCPGTTILYFHCAIKPAALSGDTVNLLNAKWK